MATIPLILSWLAGLYLVEIGLFAVQEMLWVGGLSLPGILLSRRLPHARVCFLCCLSLSLGAGRMLLAQPHLDEKSLATYNDRGSVTIQGIVDSRPDILGSSQKLLIHAGSIEGAGISARKVHGYVLVQSDVYSRYSYGDLLELKGSLTTPPRLGDFDYRQVLAQKGIYSLMYRPQIRRLASGQGHPLASHLYRFKDQVVHTVADILPMPEAGLLAGILVGDESGISTYMDDCFRATGTSHIVVISGWNVAVLAGLILGFFRPLIGRRPSIYLAVGCVMGYTLLVGFDPPVVRAAIMGILTLFALLSGRQAWALNSLALAAFLMTLYQPYTLWGLGFQLSFAATLGLVLFQPPLKNGLASVMGRCGLSSQLRLFRAFEELILVTLAAQILVLPILAYRTGEFSLITLPANILIVPLQPFALGLGALAAVGGLLWLPLGRVLGWLAWPFLTLTTRGVEWLASLPAASANVPRPSAAAVILYYLLALGVAGYLQLDVEHRRYIAQRFRTAIPAWAGAFGLGIAALLIWTAVWYQPDGRLLVHVLDVGQGDAILIRTPSGRDILIDGGPDGPTMLSALGRRLPFWDRHLDVIVATHGDSDHITGLFAVLERYRVALVISPGISSDSAALRPWQESLETNAAHEIEGHTGTLLIMPDGVELELLHPPPDMPEFYSSNDRSIVSILRYGSFCMLLTGDLESAGERILLSAGVPLECQILKVSHHGAATGSSDAFLDAVTPRIAVISAGAGNRFGHPAPAVLNRLEERSISLWRTDKDSNITLISDGERLWIRTGR